MADLKRYSNFLAISEWLCLASGNEINSNVQQFLLARSVGKVEELLGCKLRDRAHGFIVDRVAISPATSAFAQYLYVKTFARPLPEI
jgi:hypothetical protein